MSEPRLCSFFSETQALSPKPWQIMTTKAIFTLGNEIMRRNVLFRKKGVLEDECQLTPSYSRKITENKNAILNATFIRQPQIPSFLCKICISKWRLKLLRREKEGLTCHMCLFPELSFVQAFQSSLENMSRFRKVTLPSSIFRGSISPVLVTLKNKIIFPSKR